MPFPFPCCPVVREWLWKKTQTEKKKIPFVQFVLVMHRSQNTCCDPCFFKRKRKTSNWTILYAQQHLKGCLAWALLNKSTDWIAGYAKYVLFKDTSWTEMLHVLEEFHSTVLHGWTVSPHNMIRYAHFRFSHLHSFHNKLYIYVIFYPRNYIKKDIWISTTN